MEQAGWVEMRKLILFMTTVALWGQEVNVSLRSRVEAYRGSGQWQTFWGSADRLT